MLVTTSWYGKQSGETARRNDLTLMDGRNLKALLLEHLASTR
ncbi:hypothetical protein [Kitasatospora griseola]